MSKEDMEGLRLDMVREIRDMKQSINDANKTNTDILNELRSQNQNLQRQQMSQ